MATDPQVPYVEQDRVVRVADTQEGPCRSVVKAGQVDDDVGAAGRVVDLDLAVGAELDGHLVGDGLPSDKVDARCGGPACPDRIYRQEATGRGARDGEIAGNRSGPRDHPARSPEDDLQLLA